jgi:hypothetical protein
METQESRRSFDALARQSGFARARGANWVRQSPETVVAINLQRSNYGRSYYVNFKVWMQGFAGRTYVVDNDLLSGTGHIFRRTPRDYEAALDLESELAQVDRLASLAEMFSTLLAPLARAFETQDGIRRCALEQPGEIFLLPAVREYLGVQSS